MKYRKIKVGKQYKNRTNLMLFLLFTCFTLCLSVGYAALNRELKISGEATFRVDADIRITSVSLYETENVGLENYNSNYSKNTIKLGVDLKQVNSTVSYKVVVVNKGNVAMWIDSVSQEINNNDNMEYVINGIGIKELIEPATTKEFIVKIKYKNSITTLPSNTNLDTVLKFDFKKPESTLATGGGSATSTFFNNGPITKNKVESITFLPTLDPVENAIGYWDASENKDSTVIASYKDSDNNGLYELYIGGVGEVYAPKNSSVLFGYFTSLKEISFGNYFNTSNVNLMYAMFYNCSSLSKLDLSKFNISNVTMLGNSEWNMGMFYNCSKLTTLNVSNWDTSNVTEFRNLFRGCSKLVDLDVSGWNVSKAVSMADMFINCSSLTKIDVTGFDTSLATSMAYMFAGCSSLSELDLSSFDFSKITSYTNAFQNMNKLSMLYVKDQASKDFINKVNSGINCVIKEA